MPKICSNPRPYILDARLYGHAHLKPVILNPIFLKLLSFTQMIFFCSDIVGQSIWMNLHWTVCENE